MAVVGPSHKLFSLRKFAYCACDEEERSFYEEYETVKVDVKKCCFELLDFLKVKEKYSTYFDYYGSSTTSEILVEAVKIKVSRRIVDFVKTKQSIIETAAQNGHVECMSMMASYAPSLCVPDTCLLAATNGQLEFLKHAHELGFPWNEEVIEMAAANNHLDCIIYAHENGCQWTQQACCKALIHSHYDVLEYLLLCEYALENEAEKEKENTSLATNSRTACGETKRVKLE